MTTLSHAAARRVYDRIGRTQDSQAFYEDAATDELVAHLKLESAHSVFEFGCGTGRFASSVLTRHLPKDAVYRAVDLSPVMVNLARSRLTPFGERASVRQTEGGAPSDEPSEAYDRFISNFVLDLLSEDDIGKVIGEAHRLLRAGGMLGLCSLTEGLTAPSRAFMWVLARVHSFRPSLVGGCRPLNLLAFLPHRCWVVRHHLRVARWAVPLEAVVAERV
jgi:ubiquinone/menaquinone biosynthesis C-methylase UbiE